jgi:hypothetical protein
LSELILQSHSLPSFAESVEVSTTELPREEDKDIPREHWAHNHYLQAAAVISFDCTGSNMRHVLGYYRAGLPGILEHTPGLSVLWAASFRYNVRDYLPDLMDGWMEEGRYSPVRARNRFTAERHSVLAALLTRKIRLTGLPLKIAPYAVITNDQRDVAAGLRRVYTQYVFNVHLPVWRSSEECMADLQDRAPGFRLCPLPQDEAAKREQEQQFSDSSTGKHNLMDILAWRGMFTNKRRLSIKKATLTKGFDLLPKRSREKAVC